MIALRSICTALAAALAGCGAAPFDYQSPAEMSRGPGLLSGKEGAFVLRLGTTAPPPAALDQGHEFERWKRAAEGSEEYREFLDWREWREWRRRNAR